ncbi:MAG TPA: hypothetical protein VD998_02785 [Verrucomicrobiae bacterium]|nr:hypothetical protein [Verrucomicrobiae bacterium]
MRNLKLEEGLVGADNWPSMGMVKVPPDPAAAHLPDGLSDEEKEEIIQGWKTVAVLKVAPITNFRVAFLVDDHMQFLKHPIQTLNGKFGVRVGARPVKFFVIPEDLNTEMSLEHIDTVKENNPNYEDLPVY